MTPAELAGVRDDLEGDPTNENCVENNFDGGILDVVSKTTVSIEPA